VGISALFDKMEKRDASARSSLSVNEVLDGQQLVGSRETLGMTLRFQCVMILAQHELSRHLSDKLSAVTHDQNVFMIPFEIEPTKFCFKLPLNYGVKGEN
jgi:hypothetical protein